MKRTVVIDVKPTVGETVSYTPAEGSAFDLIVETVVGGPTDVIDGVLAPSARTSFSGTPTRYSSIPYDPSGKPNTWRFQDEVSATPAPALAAHHTAGAPPPPPVPPNATKKEKP